MDAAVKPQTGDKFVTVAGLKTRYFEEGEGPAALLLHGASLGSSADVWRRNLAPLAGQGIRAIAYDQPGFGLSDDPPDWALGFRTAFILKFMDALRLDRASLVGHSQAGAMAVDLALSHPDRVSRVVVLGTGSLLPPLADAPKKSGPAEGEEGGDAEPTLAEARAGLESTLYNQTLATDEEVAIRLRMSTGKNHRAFLARNRTSAAKNSGSKDLAKKPLWQRLTEVRQPLLLIYGREDRGQAAKRAELAKQQFPSLDLHIVPNCKHLVQWDAADEFHRLAGPFVRG
jgi:4,5:9,10-diseco-3-hydroxy-5,9,17-trioxoandrosta-1(10),2-diene-4-oate hydrolase